MTIGSPFIHRLSDVQTRQVGAGTRIWQFTLVLPRAVIGSECNVCSHCFVENDVVVGDRVTIKSGVQLWGGLRLQDDVFVGPSATFTNDRYPRSRRADFVPEQTVIERRASGAVILSGIRIGAGATVGAGAVVTRDAAPATIVVGNPAQAIRIFRPDAC